MYKVSKRIAAVHFPHIAASQIRIYIDALRQKDPVNNVDNAVWCLNIGGDDLRAAVDCGHGAESYAYVTVKCRDITSLELSWEDVSAYNVVGKNWNKLCGCQISDTRNSKCCEESFKSFIRRSKNGKVTGAVE